MTLSSNGNYVVSCNLSNCMMGVYSYVANGLTVISCTISNCILGIQGMSSHSLIVRMNTITGCSQYGVYFSSGTGWNIMENDISLSASGIFMYNAQFSYVSWNTISNCTGKGIWMSYGSFVQIHNNTLVDNYDGVYIEGSMFDNVESMLVRDNTIDSGTRYGIFMLRTDESTVCWNNVTNNQYGIMISGTDTNRNWIFLNRFVGNAIGAYSDWSGNNNYWNTSVKVDYWWAGTLYNGYLGNYWSDYSGVDADNNGVGDTAYVFTGERDNYPLMGDPWSTIPEYPSAALPSLLLLCAILFIGVRARSARKGK
jgi:parallel beta-helix repeat protein